MEATMINHKVALLVLLTASIFVTSGALTILAHPNGAHAPTPAQVDPVDLMSKATVLPEQTIESPF
jgi:hypothetical protein